MIKFAACRVRAMRLPLVPLIWLAAMAAPLHAQSTASPTPSPTPLPNLIPGLENFSLQPGPGTTMTRPATPPPVVRTVPTPVPTPTSVRPATSPQPRAATTPVPRVTPSPTPTPRSTPTPVVTPTPSVPVAPIPVAPAEPAQTAPAPAAGPVIAPAPVPAVATGSGDSSWMLLGGAGALALLLGGLGFWFLQRRQTGGEESFISDQQDHARFDLAAGRPDAPSEPVEAQSAFRPAIPMQPPAPAEATFDLGVPPKRGKHAIFDLGAVATELPPPMATPEPGSSTRLEEPASPPPVREVPSPTPPPAGEASSPVAASPVAAAPARATLDVELYAKRAGTNLLSAAVEYDIVVRNMGDAAARGVQVDVRLLSAGAEQDGWIGALFSSPIERSITPAFDLPSRGAIELSGMAMMPKELVSVMNVQDRKLFVPVLVINLLYAWEGGAGQTATSYVVGIERGEGAKLAPFRLDGTPRMHEGVSTLPYLVSVRR